MVQVHGAQPQIEICTLKLERPSANSHGDWCRVTEDRMVNTVASVCSGSAGSVQGTVSPGGQSLEPRNLERNVTVVQALGEGVP